MQKLLAVIFLCAGILQAQDDRFSAFLFNIGTAPFGNFEGSFERKWNEKFSLSLAASYYDGRIAITRIYSLGYQGNIGLALKFHVVGKAHEESIYLAPTLKAGYLVHPAQNDAEETDKNILVRTGGVFGYTNLFFERLLLDINAGLEHYQSKRIDKPATRFEKSDLMIRFIYGASIGYAF